MPIHGYPGGVISATPPTVSVSSASGVWTTEKQLQYQAQGVWPPGGVYPITRSLRFNSADSAYLNRTPGSAGNRKTWTWSGWVKRSAISSSTSYALFSTFTANNDSSCNILMFANDDLRFTAYSTLYISTTQLFRDVSAWYHIVFAVDTTQATSTNRLKLYVNGSQITAFASSSYPSQNADLAINNNTLQTIGITNEVGTLNRKFDGYLTEVNFIDGQALTPSSFGQTNSITGVWEPKPYTGTYGTNGFYLNFSDNSGTTSTTLGKDYSGNGNNWTPNNFSVTAGAGNDSLVDSPTAYGFDTGVGGEVRGNYCTLNPLSTSRTLTNGNLYTEVNGGGGSNIPISATMAIPTTGKWYWEITAGGSAGGGNGGWDWGIVNITVPNFRLNNLIVVGTGGCYGVNGNDGNFRENNVTGITGYISGGITNGDVAQVAYDADNGKLWLGKNNTWGNNGSGNGDPAAGLRPAKTAAGGMTGQFIPVFEYASDSGVVSATANFGQRPFAYTAPSGFKALCTQNLPTPTVVQGDDYFNTVLWSGNGSTQSITGVGFQPDLVWYKGRTNAYNHRWFDVIRGATNAISSNLTDAESSVSGVTAFNSDGFSLGSDVGGNNSGQTYVAWNWKANGAGSTNTAGSITSTVSANTTSGFSVVTYTGTGANATVGHGLGAAPSMIIIKIRSSSSYGWLVGHVGLTNQTTYYIDLNSAGAEASNSTVWNSTAPTSSVISLGTNVVVNTSSATYVAYCFAAIPGFSAFGRYTGNGSTDGPFVYTGFRPRWLMLKATSGTTFDWGIFDTARNPYNVTDLLLRANTSGAEQTDTLGPSDLLSNGFKFRGPASSFGFNVSGTNYIYAAFAENPFKYALAR